MPESIPNRDQPIVGPSRKEHLRRTLALWEKSLAAELQEREQARQLLLARAEQELPAFFQKKRVKKVYLTGSLLRAEYFYPFSDIDLAVEGLQEDYL